MSALGYFYLSNQHTLSILFNRKLGAPENIERRQAHLVDMVISYLMRKPEPGDWTPALARGAWTDTRPSSGLIV
jgi:TetR/AcrR family transcriptional regulator